ncbi:MAG: hypothetical protein P0S95_03205 [Rhabdochlamydiaceae bacterium]|nr:hypothetical protein [Candidatus Amphrikana amoebophyrae]
MLNAIVDGLDCFEFSTLFEPSTACSSGSMQNEIEGICHLANAFFDVMSYLDNQLQPTYTPTFIILDLYSPSVFSVIQFIDRSESFGVLVRDLHTDSDVNEEQTQANPMENGKPAVAGGNLMANNEPEVAADTENGKPIATENGKPVVLGCMENGKFIIADDVDQEDGKRAKIKIDSELPPLMSSDLEQVNTMSDGKRVPPSKNEEPPA